MTVLTFGFYSGVRQLQYIVVVNAKSQIILSTDKSSSLTTSNMDHQLLRQMSVR